MSCVFIIAGVLFSYSIMYPRTVQARIDVDSSIAVPAGQGLFSVHYNFGGSRNNGHAILGDIEGDGDLDIITPGLIYINNNSGIFTSTISFAVNLEYIADIAVGDIDNDSDIDILIGYGNDTSADIYLNNKGVFSAERKFGAGGIVDLGLVDINNDGFLDIVSSSNDRQSSIYISDNGYFQIGAPSCENVSKVHCFGNGTENHRSLSLDDMDGDGDVDIIVGCEGSDIIYKNDGQGIFNVKYYFHQSNDDTSAIATGDLDGDNDIDIVAGNFNDNTNGQADLIFINDGMGEFSEPRYLDQGRTKMIDLADVDSDGDDDIVIARWYNQTKVYYNDGSGFFGTTENIGANDDPMEYAIAGDINEDSHIDLIVHHGSINTLYLNNGSGEYFKKKSFSNGEFTTSVVLADIDGDADLDTIAGKRMSRSMIYLNDGSGRSTETRMFGLEGLDTYTIAVSDINNDGDSDIIAGTSKGVLVYENNNLDINTYSIISYQYSISDTLVVGDMNGDMIKDVVIGRLNGYSSIYINQGDVDFSDPYLINQSSNNISDMVVVDIDRDNDNDIVSSRLNQPHTIYINNGSGIFDTMRSYGTPVNKFTTLAIGDVNADTYPDIAIASNGGQNVLYLNQWLTGTFAEVPFGTGEDLNTSIALADIDNDLDKDIIIGSELYYDEDTDTFTPIDVNNIYINTGNGNFNDGVPVGEFYANTSSLAVGDVNGDNWADIALVNNGYSQNAIYINVNGGFYYDDAFNRDCEREDVRCFDVSGDVIFADYADLNADGMIDILSSGAYRSNLSFGMPSGEFSSSKILDQLKYVFAQTIGDLDGDQDLDIVAVGEQQQILLNNGAGDFSDTRTFDLDADDWILDVNLADIDHDQDLDILATTFNSQHIIYINDGSAHFLNTRSFTSDDTQNLTVTPGDVDNDGDLDIVVGGNYTNNVVYFNDGRGIFDHSGQFGTEAFETHILVLADVNADGSLDAITGNYLDQDVIYLNDGAGGFYKGDIHCDNPRIICFGSGSDKTLSLAAADIDNDRDIDIIAQYTYEAGLVYLNDGSHTFAVSRQIGSALGGKIAVADIDADGDKDIIGANIVLVNNLYTHIQRSRQLPRLTVRRPGTPAAASYSAPAIISTQFITLTYTLHDDDHPYIGIVRGFYSPDDGGTWFPAVPTVTTPIYHLPSTGTYTYTWDTFKSGFFGMSDTILFRLEVIPSPVLNPGGVVRPYRLASAISDSPRFSVRGTQVRVLRNAQPVAGAHVYRKAAQGALIGVPLGSTADTPFTTDAQGYLRGRGQMTLGDQLTAMVPFTGTESYTVFMTNAIPTTTGINSFNVVHAGVQELSVSTSHSLLVLNLTVSLEWDARADTQFMGQLRSDLDRTSRLLFDWSNGQVALGTITIYQDRAYWNDAHIRIYATNRLRPNATMGGIVSPGMVVSDPVTSSLKYGAGQVRMGAVWTRFGDAEGTISEDWARTLAHELGHFALYLNDNYLGHNAQGQIVSVTSCPGAMADPYRDDFSEFHPAVDWVQDCKQTMSHQDTGRSDWSTITLFYPWLMAPTVPFSQVNAGPTTLPLAITRLVEHDPISPTTTLPAPYIFLRFNGSPIEPGSSTRAVLFQGEQLLDIGQPVSDRILARGAKPGDRLCIYEPNATRSGCTTITPTNFALTMVSHPTWKPQILVSPVTSQTLAISVTNISDHVVLHAQFYPSDGPASAPITLLRSGQAYSGTVQLLEPGFEGMVHIWVDEPEQRREALSDFSMLGNPGHRWARRAPRSSPGHRWARRAPILSSDGQVLLDDNQIDFREGEFLSIQSASSLPNPLPWATPIGQGYYVMANFPLSLTHATISFNYLGNIVSPLEEPWISIYFWNNTTWQALPTTLDAEHNFASAMANKPGLYVLMSSYGQGFPIPGWNQLKYLFNNPRSVVDGMQSIEGRYTILYGRDPRQILPSWHVYDPSAPTWVNNLQTLDRNSDYFIHTTQPVTVYMQIENRPLPHKPFAYEPQLDIFPPAIYYGKVLASDGFQPATGMPIKAYIDDHLCGSSTLQLQDSVIVYKIEVNAINLTENGCGMYGKTIRFEINNRAMVTHAVWDNRRTWRVPLSKDPFRSFMPTLLNK
jgi:hypothetical protein